MRRSSSRPASSAEPGRETIPAGRLVVVSPHLDDGVMSCGELLAQHPGSTVITALAGRPPLEAPLTEWDAAAGFVPGDDVVGMRREEDRRALTLLSAQPVWLDFLDSQYQHTPDVAELAAAIERSIRAHAPTAVFFPLGLFHSDHTLVSDACLTLVARQPAIAWLAYEDCLYRALPHLLDRRLDELRAGGVTLMPAGTSGGDHLALKRHAVLQYASQLRALATPGRPGHADALAPERYWRVDVAEASAGARRQVRTPTWEEAGPHPGPLPILGEGEGHAGEMEAAPDPRVGAVVLTYNRRDELDATLTRLERLPEQPSIIVVDNASRDGTAGMVHARHPGAICVRLKRNIGAAARNVGVRICDHPYVALCDDDTWWEPGSLRRGADLLDAYPALAVITAQVVIGPECRLDPACRPMAESPLAAPPDLPGKPLLGFLAGASMVRRSAFLAAGGFEPRLFLGGEEELLAYDLAAAGWQLSYIDALTVHHYPSPLRDAGARRRLLDRNHLWIAWMRRPGGRALAETLRLLSQSVTDGGARRALLSAACGLPWALRRRRTLSRTIELGIRQLEGFGFR